MQFDQGASIFTADGQEVGHIDRVVIDPKTKEVTHVVVRKGFLFVKDKVVPIDLIAAGKEGRITLHIDKDKLEQLPDFEETYFVVLNERELGRDAESAARGNAPSLYWYPPYLETPLAPMASFRQPAYVAETRTNIPQDTVAVAEGARVITRDGQYVGNVEQVLTDSRADRVTHFLIARGLLKKEKKLIPAGWLDRLGEDELRLAVGSSTVERLPVVEPDVRGYPPRST